MNQELHADSRKVAAMGARAAVEYVAIDKGGVDLGTFTKNLDSLERTGCILSQQRAFLSTILDAGHAAMHRTYTPSPDDLSAVMDILENVLLTVYVLPNAGEALQQNVPPKRSLPRRG